VAGEWDTRLPFLAHNQQADRQVQELEHKARRQDVLVDDELIHAFYDQQLPPTCAAAPRWSAGTATRSSASPSCCS
jgi:ATP-dependent helicase HrpA